MTLISRKQEKHCLVACSEENVNAGRCDCVNRMREEVKNTKIMEDLKQGTRVEFDVQNFKGKGTIVGVATSGQPIIGASYIIEPDEKLQSEVYDYSHFVAWECQFKVIPENQHSIPPCSNNSLPTEDQGIDNIKKMRKEEVLILGRGDMTESKNGKSILFIHLDDFKISAKPMQENGIVLFIDDNGQTKILKNRYGDKGNGVFIRTIEDMKQNSIDNDLGYAEGYFDDIISLYEKM